MSHTPGPWSFDHDWRRLPTIFAADGKTKVATIEKKSREFHTAEQEADARLIAAAPDMLVALERAREAVNAIVLSTRSISFDADLRAIDTALEAARGGCWHARPVPRGAPRSPGIPQ